MSPDFEDFEFALGERFGKIWNQAPVATPRALAALIAAERFQWPSHVSPTVRAFYRLRLVLSQQLGVDARSITPRTSCATLMPDVAHRRVQWQRVRDTLGIRRAPRLSRPQPLAWTLAFLTVVTALVGGMFAPPPFSSSFSVYAALLSGYIAAHLYARVTRHWARHFHPSDLTVGTLAHCVVAYGSPILGDVKTPVNAAQTLEVVQALARLEIGVNNVHPDETWETLDIRARAS